ncbi:FAD-dependent thymidylate synthase [Candidatus Microgenomates bacterium]|nr:FAD-dependent thymidylate synthase [Candidatus Microgenomates bacterium]
MHRELEGNLHVEPEQKQTTESPVRVYPMGFVPEIKRQLLASTEARITNNRRISEVGQAIRESVRRFTTDEIELNEFLAQMNMLDEVVKDGERATKEEREFITHALRTEEELAVIFARVSRGPGSFEDNAREVTEEGAAQFHQKWVVSVEGYGHASVAEHSVIHMAVENVPSLDGDWLTDNRLASFTEFSARFKGRQGVGYFTPESVARDPRLAQRWHEVHGIVFATYDDLVAKGWVYINTDEARKKAAEAGTARPILEKQVADQYKNLMPASRLTSIGVTLNAREAESVIRKMLSSPYPSVQELGARFKEEALKVSPTLVKYADSNEYMVAARRGIGQIVEEERYHSDVPEAKEGGRLVDLVEADERADDKFIAAALYSDPRTGSFRNLLEKAGSLTVDKKRQIIGQFLGQLGAHDVPIRPLEMPGDYIIEFPGMTYGVWRDFKRHRMQFYQAKDLDVRWGWMIPPLAYEMDDSEDPQFHGSVEAIKQALWAVDNLFAEVVQVDPYAAQYAVTRFHRRPAIAKFNVREAYHLIDLRSGRTAHPFVRQLIWPLFDRIREVQPILYDHLRMKMSQRTRPNRGNPWSF